MSNNFQSIRETIYSLEAQIASVANNLKNSRAKLAMDYAHNQCQQVTEYIRTAEKREADNK